jgi:hypothetical protein
MTLTTRNLKFGLALAASLAAVPASSASARPIDQFPPSPAAPQVRVVHVSTESGFDWGDAEIGAGTTFALVLIGAAGALGLRHHRRGRSGQASFSGASR